MRGIIFQIVVVLFVVGLLILVALDDRRTRALREREEAEEQHQAKPSSDRQR